MGWLAVTGTTLLAAGERERSSLEREGNDRAWLGFFLFSTQQASRDSSSGQEPCTASSGQTNLPVTYNCTVSQLDNPATDREPTLLMKTVVTLSGSLFHSVVSCWPRQ